ncbi:hypothetical protein E2F47_06110 [Mycobacterium eburneum]|nr:hypothetical protein [Mycobacterium eburneum]TDH56701.1 hypothetical protein E2F47_06110 [Mycobacterium eburneum]
MRPSTRGWLRVAEVVIDWDLTCERGETLSAGGRRARESHPFITIAAAIYLAGHVLGLLPRRYDLIHRIGVVVRP